MGGRLVEKKRFFGQLAEISKKRQYLSEKTNLFLNLLCQRNSSLCFPNQVKKKYRSILPLIQINNISLCCVLWRGGGGRERRTLIIQRSSHIKKGAGLATVLSLLFFVCLVKLLLLLQQETISSLFAVIKLLHSINRLSNQQRQQQQQRLLFKHRWMVSKKVREATVCPAK